MTPIRAMPGWLRALTCLNPVRYYAEVMRDDAPARRRLRASSGRSSSRSSSSASAILATATLRFHKRIA